MAESELVQGEWTDPDLSTGTVQEFGEQWISEHKISLRTREEYDSLFRHHVEPYLGAVEIGQLTTDQVRSWRRHCSVTGARRTGPRRPTGYSARS
ncbi:N-terminal phage integrase SAM-like domain-containing protein [Pseudonocardia xinjiangensis]|uniref:N-terminal phage integrase SAM-like domain-containing protein n=1 Tax=Pseudonocardia xinjiangensis TaxID=75289 RepID=UPI001FECD566|nr:N-terminal phage integrase SAM-like domain-containing protein [Pseudonocardia xinjiangensis]